MYNILEKITDNREKEIVSRYMSNTPIDVLSLARDLDIEVKQTPDLPESISGFIKQDDAIVYIYINSHHHINRQRFTVAHELGHYFEHRSRLQQGLVDKRGCERTKIEKEADNFAGNLLMPDKYFRSLWVNENYSIEYIANYFRVSIDAVKVRANCLNLT
jgi:Zn-dependent peptidase ImmA (M78 family)